jgi:hypothetical protein
MCLIFKKKKMCYKYIRLLNKINIITNQAKNHI